jgi:hypothetical protein
MHLYDALSARLQGDDDHKGRTHADCPFCGAAGRTRGHRPAYHFYIYEFASKGSGYVCWACGAKGTLRELATRLDVAGDETPRPLPDTPRDPTPPWTLPGALDRYTAFVMDAERHAQIVAAWHRYKPLPEALITRERLGFGKLAFYDEARAVWYAGKYPRLLVPLIVGQRIVGMRGRAVERHDTGPKWLTASASEPALMGLERVTEGSTVVWCENLVDRLLAEADAPGMVFVASGGLTWQAGWLAALARRKPARVVVWFDHDLAGNGGGSERHAMLSRWRQALLARRATQGIDPRIPLPQAPVSRGAVLVEELTQAGLKAELYDWPAGTPEKADLGWLLQQGGQA